MHFPQYTSTKSIMNRNVDIKFSVHDMFLEPFINNTQNQKIRKLNNLKMLETKGHKQDSPNLYLREEI
jgi:hypothetical protein